jgi:hypothetical protein
MISPESLLAMELVTRTCACGCRATFRCLPASSQAYASKACLELGPPPTDEAGRVLKRRGRKRKHPPSLP